MYNKRVKKKVLISGAGPAGLVLSQLLDADKYEVSLIEKGPKIMNMGYSIILWKAGYDVLENVIGKNKISSITYPINKISVIAGDTFEMIGVSDTKHIGHSIERKKMMGALESSFSDRFGLDKITYSTYIKDIVFESKAKVRFNDGYEDFFDFVIAADGIYSYIRDQNFNVKSHKGPYRIVYKWIKPGSGLNEESLIGFKKNVVYLVQTVADKALLAYYNNGDVEENTLFEKALIHHINMTYGGNLVIDQKNSCTFIAQEIKVATPYKNHLALIGDALHGHPPTLAMGTSLALEDAKELAVVMNKNTGQHVTEIYREFYSLREKRLSEVFISQKLIEELFIDDKRIHIDMVHYMMKIGGFFFMDRLMRHIVT